MTKGWNTRRQICEEMEKNVHDKQNVSWIG